MSDDRNETERMSGWRADASESGSGSLENRSAAIDCCGTWKGDDMAGCPCGTWMKKRPVIASAILVVMSLAFFVIPAGAILGIIAFFRSI